MHDLKDFGEMSNQRLIQIVISKIEEKIKNIPKIVNLNEILLGNSLRID